MAELRTVGVPNGVLAQSHEDQGHRPGPFRSVSTMSERQRLQPRVRPAQGFVVTVSAGRTCPGLRVTPGLVEALDDSERTQLSVGSARLEEPQQGRHAEALGHRPALGQQGRRPLAVTGGVAAKQALGPPLPGLGGHRRGAEALLQMEARAEQLLGFVVTALHARTAARRLSTAAHLCYAGRHHHAALRVEAPTERSRRLDMADGEGGPVRTCGG